MAASDKQEAYLKEKYGGMRNKGSPLEQLKAHTLAQGTHGIRMICKFFKKLDDVGDGDRRLQMDEFVKGFLKAEELNMDEKTLIALFHEIDATGRGNINFREFYAALKPPIDDKRLREVTRAFARFDLNGDGEISLEELKKLYSPKSHPKFKSGEWKEEEVFDRWMSQFGANPGGTISNMDFLNYYIAVSASIEKTEDFYAMMKEAWQST